MKKRIVWLGFSGLITLAVTFPATLLAAPPPPQKAVSQAVTQTPPHCQLSVQQELALKKVQQSAERSSDLIRNVEYLSDHIGGRVTGTPSMDQAAQWAKQKFLQAGVDSVKMEPYSIAKGWQAGPIRLVIKKPTDISNQKWNLAALGWSASTPKDGLVAPLVDVGFGQLLDFKAQKDHLKGAIILVHSRPIIDGKMEYDWFVLDQKLNRLAHQFEVGAILWMGNRPQGLLYRNPALVTGEIDSIPQAVLAREQAQHLARLLRREPVVAQLSIKNQTTTGPISVQNVVADIKGCKHPNQIVLLGAHLDSWELGTGSLDNGVNAAMLIDIAHTMKQAGVCPDRTIRFVLFSGEEQGALGSVAYTKTHAPELANTVAAFIIDLGTGAITGLSLNGRADLRDQTGRLLCPVEALGVDKTAREVSTELAGFTDNYGFLLQGIPNLTVTQEADHYWENYHASSDTFDKVNRKNLKKNSEIMALVAMDLANQRKPLGTVLTHDQVGELLKRTGLEANMKIYGTYDAWAAQGK